MRIDKFLAQKFGSRTKASDAIERGLVLVNGKSTHTSYEVKKCDEITFLAPRESYVSNGGYKLSKALKDFSFTVKDLIFADIGASNGGFTDCLLQNGARKVYCVDVGESQLDASLRDKNVVIFDKFNARNLNAGMFSEELDGIVIDVSFISLTYILKQVADVLRDEKYVIALVKPQFECESKSIGKRGIVKDTDTHKKVLKKICVFAEECNLAVIGITNAPIIEGKNKEYLILLKKGVKQVCKISDLINSVKL